MPRKPAIGSDEIVRSIGTDGEDFDDRNLSAKGVCDAEKGRESN